MATGDEASVQKFIEWCRRGPKKAEVADVIVTKKEEIKCCMKDQIEY